MTNAERQKAYRERKKAAKAAELNMQAPIDPAPESAMQSPSVMELMEGHPDDLPPVKIEPETITYFDVYKRRHEGMFK